MVAVEEFKYKVVVAEPEAAISVDGVDVATPNAPPIAKLPLEAVVVALPPTVKSAPTYKAFVVDAFPVTTIASVIGQIPF